MMVRSGNENLRQPDRKVSFGKEEEEDDASSSSSSSSIPPSPPRRRSYDCEENPVQVFYLIKWDLVKWLERCASIPMITSLNPTGGSEFTFRSDLLLSARGGST
jgi:hypothetical protein